MTKTGLIRQRFVKGFPLPEPLSAARGGRPFYAPALRENGSSARSRMPLRCASRMP